MSAGVTSAAAQDNASGTQLEEVVVTAQKTSEIASKAPIALSVFSGETLQKQGVVDVTGLQNAAPSLNVGSASHGVNISIRGVASTDVTSKGEQGVVFNIDNIPIGRPQMMGLAFFDLERVEVLRGPQGTLYGKSSTGGAINVITAKPKNEFGAAAAVEFGNFNTRRGEVMVNIPLTDNFAIRAAGTFNKRDGYLNPVLGNPPPSGAKRPGDEDNMTGRLTARWAYSDDGSLIVTGTFGHVGGVTGTTNALYYRVLNEDGSAARDVYYNPMAGEVDDNFSNFNAELNQTFGGVHLTYDGARVSFKGHDNFDPSTGDPAGAPGDANYTWQDYRGDIKTTSHEVRLSNAEPQRLEWVIGANYWKETIDEKDMNWLTLASCAPSLAASCNSPNPHIVGKTQHKSKGAFGQANFHVNDALKLTAGLRYSDDAMFRKGYIAGGPAPAGGWLDASGRPCAPGAACAGFQDDTGTQAASKVTWRLGADYQINDDQMVYGSVATGYKAGSFNDVDPTSTTHGAGSYGPESLTAYEVGYKGRLLPNLQFNAAAYYYDYAKYQLTGATFMTPSVTGGSPGVVIYTTLAPAKLYGLESDLDWKITPDDRLNLGLTLSEGSFKGGANHARVGFLFVNQIDWSGKRLDNLPKVTLNGAYEHRWTLANGGTITGRVSSKYNSGYFVSDLAGDGDPFSGVYTVMPQQYKQKAFTKTDLNLTYASEDGKFSLGGFVRNLEDDLQLRGPPQGINPAGVGTLDRTVVRVSEPRTFGVRLGVKY